jgi:hypothetical protein
MTPLWWKKQVQWKMVNLHHSNHQHQQNHHHQHHHSTSFFAFGLSAERVGCAAVNSIAADPAFERAPHVWTERMEQSVKDLSVDMTKWENG